MFPPGYHVITPKAIGICGKLFKFTIISFDHRYLTVYGGFAPLQVRSPTSFASLPREVKQVRTHLPQLAPKPFKIIFVSSTELMMQIGYRKEFQS